MSRILLCIFLSSCLYLTSCSSQEIMTSYPFLESNDDQDSTVTVLFTDESDKRKENNYYDALIDVQYKYPNKLSNVNVVYESDEEIVNYYEIDTYPTLLLVNDLEVTLRIEGAQDFSSIYKKLEASLQQNSDEAS
ncbi:hypothetical protein ACM26V_09060 [Salipaludibacillus sp. HK11]|uniref:hypothetical protein n=1 Tax=Salipaludibacillus sp. HK11 TaxID=3394320 RepID=UPI0039FBCCBD